MKRVFSFLLNAICVLVILFTSAVLIKVVLTPRGNVPEIGGYSLLRVLTGSMEPTIGVDSILVVHKTTPQDIQVGDIISFYSSDPELNGTVNTHRVIEIEETGGGLLFHTRGDANALEDRYPPSQYDLVGVVVFSSRALGKVARLLSNPLFFLPVVLLPLVLILIVNFIRVVKSTKELMRQEEEQAIRQALEERKKKQQEISKRSSDSQ